MADREAWVDAGVAELTRHLEDRNREAGYNVHPDPPSTANSNRPFLRAVAAMIEAALSECNPRVCLTCAGEGAIETPFADDGTKTPCPACAGGEMGG